ncbi:flagellar basal body-associated FliL family protein [Clostridium tyrobutyricum]|jgi:flagellar FliL protein|uniref:Flagellar protein FliL n=1 Tax=Clostridium tyrobutyricum DIVETGP TaxID=1408889 RepID=W6N693_CLOTY|nr:flagellar basal body-associated FliL family protein [Clostridium tyrobutyricum]AND85275.1 flagellar biosynthesis protein FliL [Clostridium tyrobutyricum]ANP69831.1 flagellar basal body protein FliL [Clostridium tyrobutyricum]MBR9646860.1 flagellar basal body-associated FliL family protein [Clostridium tyrobutyricum]MBV4415277.1 flagellar basal body-associated FliL family protein [Clostridium tyrobutyricum]MBV4419135.1 flagellar basal body-associated FliL family protein [Clostridium tyrobuty
MENKVEKAGSSKGKLVVIFILILAVIGAGAYIGYSKFLSSSNKTGQTQNQVQNQVPQVQNTGQTQTVNSSALSQVVSSKTFQVSSTDGLTVNLADTNASRYLKVSVYFGYDEKKLTAELTEKQPMLTDAVIGILRTKKAADIVPKNMDTIKMEIIQKVNPMLKKGQINNVYFTDLIVQ